MRNGAVWGGGTCMAVKKRDENDSDGSPRVGGAGRGEWKSRKKEDTQSSPRGSYERFVTREHHSPHMPRSSYFSKAKRSTPPAEEKLPEVA